MSELENIDLSIIIVNWNARELLLDCLRSLRLDAANLAVEIFVVDNASTDGSVDAVSAHFPETRVIANSVNCGFAAANNEAAEEAHGRYLLLLNPDTEILPGTLAALIEYADAQPHIGALGPRLLNRDRTHQRSCWRGYPGLGMALIDTLYLWKMPGLFVNRSFEYRPDELLEPREVDHLLGACLLIRRETWRAVGALDEGYFIFFEETDWCWRAKQAGWQIVYQPHIEIIHYGQHSMRQQPSSSSPHYYRSYCRFYRHYQPGRWLGLIMLKITIAFTAVLRIGLWAFRAWRAKDSAARQLAQRMGAGYRQVLRELPSF